MFDVTNAEIKNNFAAFKSTSSTEGVLVESFDNLEFDVYRGTTENMVKVGVITATTDHELVTKLTELVNK